LESLGFKIKKDKKGALFLVGRGGPTDYQRLLSMYLGFSPRPAAQGLPPADPEQCCKWVEEILNASTTFIAIREGRIVGHAALIPDPKGKECEYLIFVHQDHRNRGVGTALTELAVEEAREMGCKCIWLCVETKNISAIRLYQKFGFEFCDMDICERKMMLEVARP